MSYLKFYKLERLEYPEYYNHTYKTAKMAHKVTKKLLRHFKLSRINIYYEMKKGRGVAGVGYIRLPKKDISLAVICHEIGHHVAKQKTGQWNHNHKTWIKMRQVFRYAKKYLNIFEVENWTKGNDVY